MYPEIGLFRVSGGGAGGRGAACLSTIRNTLTNSSNCKHHPAQTSTKKKSNTPVLENSGVKFIHCLEGNYGFGLPRSN